MKLRNIISMSLIAVLVMNLVVTPAFALRMHRPENVSRQAEIDKYGPCENKPNLLIGIFDAADWLVTGTFSMFGSAFDSTEKLGQNALDASSSTINSAVDTSGSAIDGTLRRSGEVIDNTMNFTNETIKGTTGVIMSPVTK